MDTRDSGNMGYTRHRSPETEDTWSTQDTGHKRQWKHGVYRTPETVETWGTQDTIHQREWKHGVHKTRNDKPETVEAWGT